MSGRPPARLLAKRAARRRYPQQSTAFVGPSQNSGNLPEIVGVPYFKSANERVSCICQLVISRTVSPSVFPSEPRMWSKDAAGNTAICAYSRAMWSCRADNVSISWTIPAVISPVRPPHGRAAARRGAMEPQPGQRAPPAGQRKLWFEPEPLASAAVKSQTPGEAPQPLTLNHPASNPGRISGRGSSFLGSAQVAAVCALFPAHDQIVAMDHLGPAGKAQDRIDVGGRAAPDLLRIFGVVGDIARGRFPRRRARE